MSSFIPQLLIISALGLMVQTAPTHICPTKRLTGANLKERLNSAARALNDARKSSPEVEIDETDDNTATKVFNLFSAECQDFTIAMTLKHRLLDDIFNNKIAVDCDSSTILTSLQTMASIFNEMKLNNNNSRCVELTPAQYKMIYEARYHKNDDVIQSLGELRKHYLQTQN